MTMDRPPVPNGEDAGRRSSGSRLVLALGWIAGLGASLLILHMLGRGQLSPPPLDDPSSGRTWLDERDTPTAAFAIVRLLAIVATWYLIAATAIGLAARLVRLPRMVHIADLATLAPVRHILSSIAGVGLTASTVSMAAVPLPVTSGSHASARRPAAAATRHRPPPPHTAATMQRLPPPTSPPGSATMRVVEEPPPPPSPPAPPPVAGPVAPAPAPSMWTVRAGDTFWHVAEATLTAMWSRPPAAHELMPYWLAVIDHNRTKLADPANPDLIFVGQVLDLPPTPPPPTDAAGP